MSDELPKAEQENNSQEILLGQSANFSDELKYYPFPNNVMFLKTTEDEFQKLIDTKPEQLKKKLGNVGVYCIGGINRSRILGKKLDDKGVDFADEKSKKGSAIVDMMDRTNLRDGVLYINETPVDTIIYAVNTEDTDEMKSALSSLPLLTKLRLFNESASLKKPLTILFVSTLEPDGL